MDLGAIREALPFIVIAGIFVFFFAISRGRKRHAQRIATVATELGLHFEPEVAPETADVLKPSRFRGPTVASNYLSGSRGRSEVEIINFRVSSTGGSGGSTRTTTVGAIPYQGPRFAVRPGDPREIESKSRARENFRQAAEALPFLGTMMQGSSAVERVEIPGDDEFSTSWMVTGEDDSAIREAVTPALQSFCKAHRDLELQSNGNRFLVFHQSEHLRPDEYAGFVEVLRELDAATRA